MQLRCLAVVIACVVLAVSGQAGDEVKANREASAEEFGEHAKDFDDFDLDKNEELDAQELRSSFKDLSPKELYRFFMDVDADSSGTASKQEYINYAVTLSS
eukprot:GDKH01007481.1.p1 GENE.GDKH01007481.1~~GDKH01007481.1.p1  ORF type:complete len:101 (+),score=23.04 GDKH01007481.1:102-404(+)